MNRDVMDTFSWANENREEFWRLITKVLKIQFKERNENDNVIDISKGMESSIYYPKAKMNICDTLLQGSDDRCAIVYMRESEMRANEKQPPIHRISMRELRATVNRIAYALTHKLKSVVQVGSAVAIDMPMTWESVAIYLGIIKAGMMVVSIADSFASEAIEVRLRMADTKLIFTQDVIVHTAKDIPLYTRVLRANPPLCVVLPGKSASGEHQKEPALCVKLRDGDMSWSEFLRDTDETKAEAVYVSSMSRANLLYSSGTTGEPKGIPWHHSTFVKCLSDGYLHQDIRQGDTVAWPTNVGWMMGPWLISQLGLGATIALFVGSPVSIDFCRFVELCKVDHLGIIPSMVKSWMHTNATSHCDWSCIRRFSSTGEASNPTLYHWVMSQAHYSPVMEYVGGTEIAGGYLSGTMLQPQLLSSFSCPCFGLNVILLDMEDCQPIQGIGIGNEKSGDYFNVQDRSIVEGECVVIGPSIGLSVELLNRNHTDVYYTGMDQIQTGAGKITLRRHGDQLRVLPNGYYQHLGRVDDTMNLGGIKVSSVGLENVVMRHPLLSKEIAAVAYRQQDVDAEKLVICAVPKDTEATFSRIFEKRPLGLQIAPAKNVGVSRVIVSKVEDPNIANEQKLRLSVLYAINGKIVWNKPFKAVVDVLASASLPIRIQFVANQFDVDKIKKELQVLVTQGLNPLFHVHDLFVVQELPRTASGKIMRRILRNDYSVSQL
ncbi:catalytic/ ligase [Reticulomyxa filosa]|uniref:Catalytic/ ligase n=1 Tax=Reticulomyxa filosa TaxID=46433 RepID=X6N4I7_RETFI|nr:catalytic/ ligase [Reticulomyxa filosa]|eukprot:ETO20828.1 catalytic/ ligase [Reticulomyxa filosa]